MTAPITPDPEAQERDNLDGLLVWLSDCGILRELAEPRITLLTRAVEARVLRQAVATVEAESRTLLRDADDAALDRLAFANRIIDALRGLGPQETTE